MKSSNIIFERMREDDLGLLHQWFQLPHVLKWYARDKKYTFKMIKEKYLPRINDASIPNFIIYDQDKPVGYIQFYCVADHLPEGIAEYNHPLFNDYRPKELVGIDLFLAEESYLRTGFGSAILALFINIHIKRKFKAVLVDPLKENFSAISFFEKNGFRHITSQDDNHDLMLLTVVIQT